MKTESAEKHLDRFLDAFAPEVAENLVLVPPRRAEGKLIAQRLESRLHVHGRLPRRDQRRQHQTRQHQTDTACHQWLLDMGRIQVVLMVWNMEDMTWQEVAAA